MCYENVRVILTCCCATKNFQALGASGASSSKAAILTPKSKIKCLRKIGPYLNKKNLQNETEIFQHQVFLTQLLILMHKEINLIVSQNSKFYLLKMFLLKRGSLKICWPSRMQNVSAFYSARWVGMHYKCPKSKTKFNRVAKYFANFIICVAAELLEFQI